MSVTLRSFNLRMPQNYLHFVDAAAVIYQQARKAVAQIMKEIIVSPIFLNLPSTQPA